MALLEYLEPDAIEERFDSDRTDELLEPFDMGGPSLMRRVLAHNPHVIDIWHEYVEALYEGNIDKYLVEYARTAASVTNECEYCANGHGEILRQKYDHSTDEVVAIREENFADFTETEEAVIRFAKQATADPRRVSESHVDALRDAGFSDGDIVELLVLTANAVASNTINDSLNIHHTDGRYQNPIELVDYSE